MASALVPTSMSVPIQARAVERLLAASLAPNTQRAYGSAWRSFSAWCDAQGLEELLLRRHAKGIERAQQ